MAGSQADRPTPVIAIYASEEDRECVAQLRQQLAFWETSGQIQVWDNSQVDAGDEAVPVIVQSIRDSSALLVVVTSRLAQSNLISNPTLQAALQNRRDRDEPSLPILFSECNWRQLPGLLNLRPLPESGRFLDALKKPAREKGLARIARQVSTLVTTPPAPRLTGRVDISRLGPPATPFLGRTAQLRWLTNARRKPAVKLTCILGEGGTGKTSLVRRWFDLVPKEIGTTQSGWVFAWSFHATRENLPPPGKLASSSFFQQLLVFLGTSAREEDVPDLAADRLLEGPNLLVLDGLELLQYPPGYEHVPAGALHDQAMKKFLFRVAYGDSGPRSHPLCIVTTRYPLSDFDARVVPTRKLDGLGARDGADLLREMKVRGPNAELEATSDELRGHPLALKLLGTYLHKTQDGDIVARRRISWTDADRREGGFVRRMIELYEQWLPEPERCILRWTGLFDGPADYEALEVLRSPPAIPGLTSCIVPLAEEDFATALANLCELDLLQPCGLSATNRARFDAHPMIRDYFRAQLKESQPHEFRSAHERLASQLRPSVADLKPWVGHVVQADLDDAKLPEVSRQLRNVIEPLPHETRCDIIKSLEISFPNWKKGSAGPRTIDPIVSTHAAKATWPGERHATAQAEVSICEFQLKWGEFRGAMHAGYRAVEIADRWGFQELKAFARFLLASALHYCGLDGEAESFFSEAEEIQTAAALHRPRLALHCGYRYCDFLLREVDRWTTMVEFPLSATPGIATREMAAKAWPVCDAVDERARVLAATERLPCLESAIDLYQYLPAESGLALRELLSGRTCLLRSILTTPWAGGQSPDQFCASSDRECLSPAAMGSASSLTGPSCPHLPVDELLDKAEMCLSSALSMLKTDSLPEETSRAFLTRSALRRFRIQRQRLTDGVVPAERTGELLRGPSSSGLTQRDEHELARAESDAAKAESLPQSNQMIPVRVDVSLELACLALVRKDWSAADAHLSTATNRIHESEASAVDVGGVTYEKLGYFRRNAEIQHLRSFLEAAGG